MHAVTDTRTLAADTSPAAELVQIEIWRRMSPAQKFALFEDFNSAVTSIAEAGIRMRHPGASPREVFLRRAALMLDPATMIAVYGWDPAQKA